MHLSRLSSENTLLLFTLVNIIIPELYYLLWYSSMNRSIRKERDFLVSCSKKSSKVDLSKVSSYDLDRYLKLCAPLIEAVKNIGANNLYPERVDNVTKRYVAPARMQYKKRGSTKITPKIADIIKSSTKCNAELGKELGLNPSVIYEFRQRLNKSLRK